MRLRNPLLQTAGAAALAFGLMLSVSAAPHSPSRNSPHLARPRFVMHVPTAADLYDRSLNADDHFSYRGRKIRTSWRSGHTVAVMVYHRAPGLDRIDYLAPEKQVGGEIISDRRQKWEYDPRRHLVQYSHLPSNADSVADAASAYSLLKTNYLVAVVPQRQTWANRKVFLLTIRRGTDHTLVRKLWIDAATGLVLKWESYREASEGGKLLVKLAETDAYTDISFRPDLTRATFDPARLTRRRGVHVREALQRRETPVPLSTVPRQLGGVWLTPSSLAGYRLVSAAVTAAPRPQLHLRYSDGLNLVSLFELRRTTTRQHTRVPHSHPLQVGSRPGRVVRRASLTAINWDTASFNLTLMGEIAQQTLQQLASAVDDRRP